jgi:hypothetical protein
MFLLLRADDELGAIDGTEVDFQAAGWVRVKGGENW